MPLDSSLFPYCWVTLLILLPVCHKCLMFIHLKVLAFFQTHNIVVLTLACTPLTPFIIFQLVLDMLSYSAASYSALARYLVLINEELMISLESFISEQLTLLKDLVSEIKVIASYCNVWFCRICLISTI